LFKIWNFSIQNGNSALPDWHGLKYIRLPTGHGFFWVESILHQRQSQSDQLEPFLVVKKKSLTTPLNNNPTLQTIITSDSHPSKFRKRASNQDKPWHRWSNKKPTMKQPNITTNDAIHWYRDSFFSLHAWFL
jgi:hypothetical protein